jgi:hypothetical protein
VSIDKDILLHAGVQLIRHSYPVVELEYGTKRVRRKNPQPLTEVSWRHHAIRQLTNPGIKITDAGLMVIDTDSSAAEQWVRDNRIESPMVTETSRGFHYWLRHAIENPTNKLKYLGLDLDLLFNGTIPFAPSYNADKDWAYRLRGKLVKPSELPVFDSGLLIQKEVRQTITRTFIAEEDRKVESARRALSKRFSVSGSGTGDLELFKTACLLVQFYGFDDQTALSLLREWNSDPSHCPTSWPDHRLVWKVREARRLKR